VQNRGSFAIKHGQFCNWKTKNRGKHAKLKNQGKRTIGPKNKSSFANGPKKGKIAKLPCFEVQLDVRNSGWLDASPLFITSTHDYSITCNSIKLAHPSKDCAL